MGANIVGQRKSSFGKMPGILIKDQRVGRRGIEQSDIIFVIYQYFCIFLNHLVTFGVPK